MILATYVLYGQPVPPQDELSVAGGVILKQYEYASLDAAVIDFSIRLRKTSKLATYYAVICHVNTDVGLEKEVVIIRSQDKVSFRKYRGLNPFYRLGGVKKKNVMMLREKPLVSASMHQRMLQMLLLSNATNDVLSKYDLSDPYQDELYEFQRAYFKE
jgi:hypothetical protein